MHRQSGSRITTPHNAGIAPPLPLPVHALPRPDLLRQLRTHTTGICFVHAPAGSGKTWLLVQHCQQVQSQGHAVVWLDIDARDNDPLTLTARLESVWSFLQGADEMPVIYIDSLQHLQDPLASTLMEDAIVRMAVRHPVFLASQRGHGARLFHARLSDQLQQLPATALRFRDEEAARLLHETFNADQARRLNGLVGGWAAGLRLLAQDVPASHQLLACPDGQAPLPEAMTTYFDDVVCASLLAHERQQLMELSVLEHFSADLLAALPGLEQTWPLVQSSIQAGRFIAFNEPHREWASFHPAFGRHLRQQLRQQQPRRHEELQLQAARWFGSHGHPAEVLRHAAALGKRPEAAELLEHAGAINIDLGTGPDIALAYRIGPEHAARMPLLFLSQIYRQIRYGQCHQAAQQFQRAHELTAGFTQLDTDSDPVSLQIWVYLMQCLLLSADDHPVEATQVERLHTLMETQRASPSVLTVGVASVLAYALNQRALPAHSAAVCRTAMQLQPHVRGDKAAVFVCLHHAWALLSGDTLTQADRQLDHAHELAQRQCHHHSYELLSVSILRAHLHHEAGHAEQALARLENVLPHIASVNGWHHLLASAFSVAAYSAARLGDMDTARRYLQAGHAQATDRQWPRLALAMDITLLELLVDSGQRQAAMEVLQSRNLALLLDEPSPDLHRQWVQAPALLAAAWLQLTLGRPRQALEGIRRANALPVTGSHQPYHLQARLLEMCAQQALRRYSTARVLMVDSLERGLRTGQLRLLQRHARDLKAVYDTSFRTDPLTVAQRDLLQTLIVGMPGQDGDRPTSPRGAENCMLSAREAQTITLMADGCTTKEIARRLGISEGTVKTHRKKIHEKLDVNSRSQALVRARELLIL